MKKYKSALFNPFHGFIKENPDPIFEPDKAQLLSGVDQMIVKYRLYLTKEIK